MTESHVTFVIATYNRPDALRCTLRALLLQAHRNWTAVVVGDYCTEATAEAVRSVHDSRISYYNLPHRFGEQAGPNNFGLELARDDGWLTFLNQDDILLPDHLPHALAQLGHHEADFFIGRIGHARSIVTNEAGRSEPVFAEALPASRDLRDLVLDNPFVFEPSSFWLIRATRAKRVGPWRPASQLWRSPLRDWIMRAWRCGCTFCFGEKLTGLKTWPQARGKVTYDTPCGDLEYIVDLLEAEPVERIRARVEEQIRSHATATLRRPRRFRPHADVVSVAKPVFAHLYLKSGIDPVNVWYWLMRRPKGGLLTRLNLGRVGSGLPATQMIAPEALANPRAFRVV